MAERTDQRTREAEVSDDIGLDEDLDVGLDDGVAAEQSSGGGVRERTPGGGSSEGERTGLRGRLGERFGGWFSVQSFVYVLLTTVLLSFLTGWLVPVVPASGLIGVFAAGFLFGSVGEDSQYTEVAAATLLAGAVTALLSNLFASLVGAGVPIVAVGAGASGLAGIVGHYVGRDLRDGLTREV